MHGEALLQAVYGSFWAMEEGKYHAMLAIVDRWSDGVRLSAEEIQARVGSPKTRTKAPEGSGVAVLPLYGLISHRAHMVQDISGPGGTSTELFGRDFDAALEDPEVGTIVLDIDSPGGNVAGVQELGDKVFNARGQKPVIAVANALAASAAYWIASAAKELVVTPSGEVGSIGVFAVHTDLSRRDANVGVQRTVLKAGRRKAEGNPYEPLGAEARAYVEQQLGEYYDSFLAAVARHRSVSPDVARSERFGEGRTVTARQAMARGMADRIATLENVLAELGVAGASPKPLRDRGSRAAMTPGVDVAAFADATVITLSPLNGPEGSARPLILHPTTNQGAVDMLSSSLAPAPTKAEEHPVSPNAAAAPDNGVASTTPHPAQVELDRQTRIRELASLVPAVTTADVDRLIREGSSVEHARQFVQSKVGAPAPLIVVGADRAADRKFASFGEQMVAIVQAGKPGGRRDPRLLAVNAAASGMNESIGSEGGFFIQNDLLPGVIMPVYDEDALLSRVKKIPIGAGKNGVKYNVIDETSRANGSRLGGIQMYWVAEADTVTAKKPKTRQMALDLKKVMGIGYLTEELMEDAPAAESLLTDAFQTELRWILGDAIFRGDGAGKPLGFMSSPALATQAIEATQTIANSGQFIATNVAKMLARIPGSLWSEVIWLYNPELLATLLTATVGANGAVPVFMAAGGLANRPNDTILGRPAFPSELCEAVGTPGDLVAIAPSQYHMADKGTQADVATSVHVRFLYDENTLKITYRCDGQPLWTSTVTPYKGAATRSPYVVLNTRT